MKDEMDNDVHRDRREYSFDKYHRISADDLRDFRKTFTYNLGLDDAKKHNKLLDVAIDNFLEANHGNICWYDRHIKTEKIWYYAKILSSVMLAIATPILANLFSTIGDVSAAGPFGTLLSGVMAGSKLMLEARKSNQVLVCYYHARQKLKKLLYDFESAWFDAGETIKRDEGAFIQAIMEMSSKAWAIVDEEAAQTVKVKFSEVGFSVGGFLPSTSSPVRNEVSVNRSENNDVLGKNAPQGEGP